VALCVLPGLTARIRAICLRKNLSHNKMTL
jgi:hypothetical protein